MDRLILMLRDKYFESRSFLRLWKYAVLVNYLDVTGEDYKDIFRYDVSDYTFRVHLDDVVN